MNHIGLWKAFLRAYSTGIEYPVKIFRLYEQAECARRARERD